MKYLDDRFNAQKELFEAKFTHVLAETRLLIGDTNERLDTIVKQNEIRNHRIENSENNLEDTNKKVNHIIDNCAYIQEGKKKFIDWWKWSVLIVIMAMGLYFTWSKRGANKVPVELFYQKTDSTLHVPRMYFRDEKTGALREVHMDYFNIE